MIAAGDEGLLLMGAMWTRFMPGIRKLRDLLDLGVYPLNFARIVFGGAPETVSSLACLGPTGVDEISGYLLRFPGGRMAVLSTTCKIVQTEVATRCIREGLAESPTMPLSESLAIVRLMDDFRSEWGLRYPGER